MCPFLCMWLSIKQDLAIILHFPFSVMKWNNNIMFLPDWKHEIEVDAHVVTKIKCQKPRDVFHCKKNTHLLVRCSCLAANKSCFLSCLCFNCGNPNGVRPAKTHHPKVKRIRRKHVWQQSHVKSSLYAHHLDEEVTKGPHTPSNIYCCRKLSSF